jgi:hypothetical protein
MTFVFVIVVKNIKNVVKIKIRLFYTLFSIHPEPFNSYSFF